MTKSISNPHRRPYICAANWKMNKSPREALEFIKAFLPKVKDLPSSTQAILFVPAIDLWPVQEALRATNVAWGAQNAHWEMEGAFTGENSPSVLAEILTPYCLVGHSERRTLFGETDAMTGKKVKSLHSVGVVPVLCIGESLIERESGQTNNVLKRQLQAGLADRDPDLNLLVAYEPVWAIGTGKSATAAMAQEAHLFIRSQLQDLGGKEFATTVPLLYGGSVRPEIAPELISQSEIDGFLIGGASLNPQTLADLTLVARQVN